MVHVPNLIECSKPNTTCKRYIPPRVIEDIPELDDDFRMIPKKKSSKKCGCNKNKKYVYFLLALLIILAFYVS